MDDLELIEEFRSDVQPPSADRVASARTMLVEQLVAGPRSRPRFRLRPAIVALAGAPAAVIAAVVLAGGLGGGGTSVADAAIIGHADQVLTGPPNEILYTKVAGGGFASESWQLTSAPYSFLAYKGPVGQAVPEEAQIGDTAQYWDPATDTIHELPGVSTRPFNSPLAAVQAALRSGDARVIGRDANVSGTPTYKIQFKSAGTFGSESLVAYVDEHTYRPILLADPQRDGTVVMLHVVALKYLAETRSNMRLLSLTDRHPSARVVTGGSATGPAPKK